eukprot:m.81737 g.81737  ORF g.81737 m.81737 type:complete len:891 (+) comp8237_c0_seq1:142-2814(+)
MRGQLFFLAASVLLVELGLVTLSAVQRNLGVSASTTPAVCPAAAVIGTDAEGRLLVCADEGQEVYIGGGVSATLARIEQDNIAQDDDIAVLRHEAWQAAWNPLGSAQEVAVNEARGMEHFTIGGDHFLAIANRADTASPTLAHIYKYDNSSQRFDLTTPWQSVTTLGAVDWEHFEIGGAHFLAMAELYNETSHIFKFNENTGFFDVSQPWQSINFMGAYAWEHFEINGAHFLAIVNVRDDSSPTASYVYEFDTSTERFEVNNPWQTIMTHGARDFLHFEIDGEHFLAVANSQLAGNYTTYSYIYKYDTTLGRFEIDKPWQTVFTSGAFDWEHFEIGGDHFLAIANYVNDHFFKMKSQIYKYSRATGIFTIDMPWQSVFTHGAVDWEHFEVGGDHFLAVANTQSTNSYIYKYDVLTDQFNVLVPFKTISSTYVLDWHSFSFRDRFFLAAASHDHAYVFSSLLQSAESLSRPNTASSASQESRLAKLEAENEELKDIVAALLSTVADLQTAVSSLNATIQTQLDDKSDIFGTGADGPWAPSDSYTSHCFYVTSDVPLGTSILTLETCDGVHPDAELLLHQTQDAISGAAGRYMFAYVTLVDNCTIQLDRRVPFDFYSGRTSDTEPQVTQAVLVPHHTDITIDAGITVFPASWNGKCGGVLVLKATRSIVVHGSISATGKGFRGAPQFISGSDYVHGYVGESEVVGYGAVRRAAAAGSGGGAGHGNGGGYGGAHSTVGSTPERGGCDVIPAGAPSPVGSSSFAQIFFGGSGGASGSHEGIDRRGAAGGRSGGIIILAARNSISISGDVQADGLKGQNGYYAPDKQQDMGGGGGGAGGSVWLVSNSVLGRSKTTALGGAGGSGHNASVGCSPSGAGGSGSTGRIRVSNDFFGVL